MNKKLRKPEQKYQSWNRTSLPYSLKWLRKQCTSCPESKSLQPLAIVSVVSCTLGTFSPTEVILPWAHLLVGTASQGRLSKSPWKTPGWSHCWGHMSWSSSGTEDLWSEGQTPGKSAVVTNTLCLPFFFHGIKLLTQQNQQNSDNMLQWIPTSDTWQAIQQTPRKQEFKAGQMVETKC